jgi:hypothetical protein
MVALLSMGAGELRVQNQGTIAAPHQSPPFWQSGIAFAVVLPPLASLYRLMYNATRTAFSLCQRPGSCQTLHRSF